MASDPLTIWAVTTTFRKNGSPVMGTMGTRAERVVVMTADTFERMIAENPCLATAQFRVGELDGE